MIVTALFLLHQTVRVAALRAATLAEANNNFESVALQRFQNYYWLGFYSAAPSLLITKRLATVSG